MQIFNGSMHRREERGRRRRVVHGKLQQEVRGMLQHKLLGMRRRLGHDKLRQEVRGMLLGKLLDRQLKFEGNFDQISKLSVINCRNLTSNWGNSSRVESVSGKDGWVAGVVSTGHIGLRVGGVDGL